MISQNSTILFQGDSITDCGRSRDAAGIPNDRAGLAQGYAGSWLDWNGRRILLSGDSIQTHGEADSLQMPCANHSVPGTEEGHAQAYRNVIPLGIDLNLGGHSSHFQDCRDIYNASFERIEQTTDLLLELFPRKSSSEIFLRDKGDALRGLNGNSDTILIR